MKVIAAVVDCRLYFGGVWRETAGYKTASKALLDLVEQIVKPNLFEDIPAGQGSILRIDQTLVLAKSGAGKPAYLIDVGHDVSEDDLYQVADALLSGEIAKILEGQK